MIKYICGLGETIAFETECDEIFNFANSFYYLNDKPSATAAPINYCVERLGCNYMVVCNGVKTPVSAEKIRQYINSSTIRLLTEAEQTASVYFHASAFITNDTAYILFNSSGSGKTTFTAYCLKNNPDRLKYMGDDVIRLDTRTGTLYGLSSGQRIKRGSKELFFNENDMCCFMEEREPIWIYKPQNKIAENFCTSSENTFLVNISYKPDADEKIVELKGVKKATAIFANTYNVKSNSRNIVNSLASLSDYRFFSIEYSDIKSLSEKLLTGHYFWKYGE